MKHEFNFISNLPLRTEEHTRHFLNVFFFFSRFLLSGFFFQDDLISARIYQSCHFACNNRHFTVNHEILLLSLLEGFSGC